MIKLNNTLKITIISYIVFSYCIYTIKPSIMFNNDQSFKKFGLNKSETIYPFWLVTTVFGFIVYLSYLIKDGNYI